MLLSDIGTLSPTCRPISLDCAKAFPHKASSTQIQTRFFLISARSPANSEPFPFQRNIELAGKNEGNAPRTGTLPAVGAGGLAPKYDYLPAFLKRSSWKLFSITFLMQVFVAL